MGHCYPTDLELASIFFSRGYFKLSISGIFGRGLSHFEKLVFSTPKVVIAMGKKKKSSWATNE